MVWLVRATQEDKSSTLRLGPNAGIMERTEASWEEDRRLERAAVPPSLARVTSKGLVRFLSQRAQREKQHGSCAGCESLECIGWAVKRGRPRKTNYGWVVQERMWTDNLRHQLSLALALLKGCAEAAL